MSNGVKGFSQSRVSDNRGPGQQGRDDVKQGSGGESAKFVPPGLAKKGGLPPGIAKKMDKEDEQNPRPQALQPNIPQNIQGLPGANPIAPIGPVIGGQVAPLGGQAPAQPVAANPINALNNSLFTPATGIPGAPPAGIPIAGIQNQALAGGPISPPPILSGVPEAFATGNPLAGPLQLVGNINQNALATARAVGIA